jgi:hypothetical protein
MTQASAAPRYELLIPAGWWQVPLHPAKRREASVRALVDRQFQGVEDQPALRHQTLEKLRGLAESAADDGDLLALSTDLVAGVPLAASLIVGVVNVMDAGRTDVSRLARAFANGEWDEVDVATLRAGRAVRRRRRVKPPAVPTS